MDCCWARSQELALRHNEFEAVRRHLSTSSQLAAEDKGWSLNKGSNSEFSNKKDAPES